MKSKSKVQSKRIPVTTRGTHTHASPRGGKIKARPNVQMCVQQGQKDEDVRRKTRLDKSVCGCDERETKCTGTTDETHLVVETWAT